MSQILEYKTYVQSIFVRKDSIFPIKEILKLDYYDFLKFIDNNVDLEIQYQVPNLHLFYRFFLFLLQIVCENETQSIQYNDTTKEIAIVVKTLPTTTKCDNDIDKPNFTINTVQLNGEIVDDIRRIIIAQNAEDFDIDEFMNRETEERLNKAQRDLNPNEQPPTIEDRIDSLMVGLHMDSEDISNLTIRKFNRLLDRAMLYEEYKTSTLALKTGMVKFKEPIKHWTSSIKVEDKYQNVKTNEESIRNKIE